MAVTKRSVIKSKPYPYGMGDGTRPARSKRNEVPADGNVNQQDQEQAAEAEAQDGEQQGDNNNNNDGDDGGRYAGPDREANAEEQVINISSDQVVKLVVTATEGKPIDKKAHPQERITKFWTNFEPDYLGGITQILPDSVAETPASSETSKKPQSEDLSPKAIHSYEDARKSCIKSVKRIIRECRANNQKYTDPHFDIERDLKVTGNRDCLYGLTSWDGEKNPCDVKRVTDVFQHPQFFKDGAGFDDIVQGALGDCWMLASLSAITANQELLRKLCVIQDQDVGVYGFVFHRDGEWHPCIIDDKLYLKAPSFDESGETVLERYGVKQLEQEQLYQETLQTGSKALYFASCRDENETWVPLFEKAFAKAHGDYSALDGGQVGEALEDFTGGVTTEIYTTNILSKEAFWQDLLRIGKDFIFSCGVSAWADWREGSQEWWENAERGTRLKGIVEHHAYSVLATYEGYGQRLVKIRNPWGSTEWSGAWSDGSKEWTPDWLYRLEHKFGDDGVFWMSYEDMLRKYKYMDRTKLFGPEWYVAQEWASVQVPWNCRDYQSTTFSVSVPEDTDAVIVLSQLDSRYFQGFEGGYDYTLSFRVQKAGEDEDEDDYFARSPVNYELSRSTNVEVKLDKGDYTVLFKVEASKRNRKEIEEVIRENIWRREKITSIATLYDLAYRKGQPSKPEKKDEPAPEEKKPEEKKEEEAKPAEKTETAPTPAAEPSKPEVNGTSQGTQTEEEKKKEQETKVEQTEEKKDEKPTEEAKVNDSTVEQKPEEKKEEATEAVKADKAEEKPAETAINQDAAQQPEAKDAPAQTAAQGSTEIKIETKTETKTVPDDKDPNRNPWNASSVVGLRIYSKLAELKIKVLQPGDKPDGVVLDRDDIAKAPQQEAEKAQE